MTVASMCSGFEQRRFTISFLIYLLVPHATVPEHAISSQITLPFLMFSKRTKKLSAENQCFLLSSRRPQPVKSVRFRLFVLNVIMCSITRNDSRESFFILAPASMAAQMPFELFKVALERNERTNQLSVNAICHSLRWWISKCIDSRRFSLTTPFGQSNKTNEKHHLQRKRTRMETERRPQYVPWFYFFHFVLSIQSMKNVNFLLNARIHLRGQHREATIDRVVEWLKCMDDPKATDQNVTNRAINECKGTNSPFTVTDVIAKMITCREHRTRCETKIEEWRETTTTTTMSIKKKPP